MTRRSCGWSGSIPAAATPSVHYGCRWRRHSSRTYRPSRAWWFIFGSLLLDTLALPLAAWIAVRWFLPYYRSTGEVSAYAMLERRFGSPAARPLYCSFDPELYAPNGAEKDYDLGYMGTYSADRAAGMERLLLGPARSCPDRTFLVAGPQYPDDIRWPAAVRRVDHVAPPSAVV